MTCIVGLAAQGKVYVGGDSAGIDGWHLVTRADRKVFRVGPFLMGFTSSFRMGQLLRFKLVAPEHPERMGGLEYMATRFVDAVRTCLKDGGYAKKENEVEHGGTFIVAYRGDLFTVEDDYQVGMSQDPFTAIGCGRQVALGSLASTVDWSDPGRRVFEALSIAVRFSAGVRGPFCVECLEGE